MKSPAPKFLLGRFLVYTVSMIFGAFFLVIWKHSFLIYWIIPITIGFAAFVILDILLFFCRHR